MPGLTALQQSEVTYLSGVNADGTLAAVSYWTWDYNAPATYHSNYQSKYGSATAGTSGRIIYSFNAASRWTDTEKSAFRSAMALWSAVANITFVEVQSGSFADNSLIISRASDGGASGGAYNYIPGRIGTTTLGQSTGSAAISIDTSVPGFGPIGSTLSNYGGYPWTTIIHELGHVIGLGHGGAYNGGDATEDPQFTQYDTLAYSLMSYNDDPNVDWGTSRGDNGNFYTNSPTTPMMLDIAAAQQLYGVATNTPLSGGQVFGFNSNITGSLQRFFDFTINAEPVVTLWDAGGGNTLDLSGSALASTVDLAQGSFSSALGLTDNIAIAIGARIDAVVAGAGNDMVHANDDGDAISTGAGADVIFGGAGNDTIDGGTGIDTLGYGELYRRSDAFFSSGTGSLGSAGGAFGFDQFSDVETIYFIDGVLTDDPNSAVASVLRLYEALLQRTPDINGIDTYTDVLATGAPLETIAGYLLASDEFARTAGSLSNADFVEYLYDHALGRASDPDGKAGWVGALDAGVSRAAVAVDFSESGEDRARPDAALAAGLFVTDQGYQEIAALYDSFAGHLPDVAGLESWAGALNSGQLTLEQIATDLAASSEFTSHTAGLTNDQLVDYMYHTTLDRDPDPQGYASWVGNLNNGLSVGDLLLSFSQSAEHIQLIRPDITNGIATI